MISGKRAIDHHSIGHIKFRQKKIQLKKKDMKTDKLPNLYTVFTKKRTKSERINEQNVIKTHENNNHVDTLNSQ